MKKKRICYPGLFSAIYKLYFPNTNTQIDISKIESETFLTLMESNIPMAFDYINCWLALNNVSLIKEDSLNTFEISVKIVVSSNQ
jgi:hypothetical protein